jgi:hypothetical protein
MPGHDRNESPGMTTPLFADMSKQNPRRLLAGDFLFVSSLRGDHG